MNQKSNSKIFIARQPIFNVHLKEIGYELFFRSGINNYFPTDISPEYATTKVVSDILHILGIKNLVGDKKAFVNFTQSILLKDFISLFPKETFVIEILEHVDPLPEVVNACKLLKNNGYILALDDFMFSEAYKPLIEMCDIIKVDFQSTEKHNRASIPLCAPGRNIVFLAEKLENYDDFQEAQDLGYTLFQGYFFCRPQILLGKDIPSYKLVLLQLLKELSTPDFKIKNIEKLIKGDVSLTYKLLRFINSASFSMKSNISSIKHAITLLGENEMKKWLTIMSVTALGEDKPDALVSMSLVRALTCESLAEKTHLKEKKSDCFLLGMMSLIDALLDKSKKDILKDLPLSENIMEALLFNSGELYPLLSLIKNFEKGRWRQFGENVSLLKLDDSIVYKTYQESLLKARSILESR